MKRGIIGIIVAIIVIASANMTVFAETSVSVDDLLSFMQGEAGADGEITLYEIFQLYAEKDHAGNADTAVPGTSVSEEKGYSSEMELLQAYTDCLNGNLSFEEFFKGFDVKGYLAYWIQEERGEITVPEAYDVLDAVENGATDIGTAFPEFARKWEERTGSAFTYEALMEFVHEFVLEEDMAYQEFSSFINELSAKFGPFDPNVQTDESWHSNYGYSDYSISVDDPDEYIQSIGIIYMERNGRYYWIMLHQTA